MAKVTVEALEPTVCLELTWKEFQTVFGSVAVSDAIDVVKSLRNYNDVYGSVPTETGLADTMLSLYGDLRTSYSKEYS